MLRGYSPLAAIVNDLLRAESAERFAEPGGKRNAPGHARIGHPQAKEQG